MWCWSHMASPMIMGKHASLSGYARNQHHCVPGVLSTNTRGCAEMLPVKDAWQCIVDMSLLMQAISHTVRQ